MVQFYQPNMKMTRTLLVHDKYAIALVNSESDAVGHLPKFMSKLAQFFVKHVRKIRC